MVRSASKDDVLAVLFGKARRAVLALLYARAGEAFYLRQIVRETGLGIGPVQRELKQLADAGIVLRSAGGRRVFYRANTGSPAFEGLKKLFAASPANTSVSREGRFNVPKRWLAAFCRRNHIRRLSLFGSMLRDDFRPDSDVNVLVEFEPGHTPGLFKMVEMEAEISTILGGRKVDLRTAQELSPYFRDQVIKEAQLQYATTR